MAQNITLLGASYSAVPAVTLPKTGGGTATFTDVTDTTAAASDVASGKYFYTAAGVKTQGTASGGGGISVDDIAQNLAPSGDIVLGSGVTSISADAFRRKPITSITGQNVKTINASAFYTCANLTTISFPNCTTFSGADIFRNTGLSGSLIFPKLTGLGGTYVFTGCENLTTGVFPIVTGAGGQQLRSCSFKTLDFSMTFSIGNYTFSGGSVNKLVLRSLSICALTNIGGFSSTPFASGGTGGTLYVPNSLLSSYQSASNWSTLIGYANNTIKSIESTHNNPNEPVDLTLYYADGSPLPTFTSVSFTRDDGKNLNTEGGYGGNTNYFCTNFIDTNGWKDYVFTSNVSYNANYCKAQAFNGDTFIGMCSVSDYPKKEINTNILQSWEIILPDGATKFRFCGYPKSNLDAKPYALYKVA